MPAQSIAQLLQRAAVDYRDNPWLSTAQGTLSFTQTLDRVRRVATGFSTLGIGSEDRIVVCMPNREESVIVFFAAVQISAVHVPLNPQLTSTELDALILHCKPKLIVVDSSSRQKFNDGEYVLIDIDNPALGADWPSLLNSDLAPVHQSSSHHTPSHQTEGAQLASIIYSSGTTGKPKGVMLSEHSLVLAARATAGNIELTSDDVVLTTNPFCHINAQVYATLASLAAGCRLWLLPEFSRSSLLDQVIDRNATVLVLAAAAIPMWWSHLEQQAPRDNPLRILLSGGTTPSLFQTIENYLELRLHTGYAMTEAPLGIMAPPPSNAASRPSPGIGRALQIDDERNDIRVIRADGTPTDNNEHGEFVICNSALMLGYYHNEEATLLRLRKNCLYTGDIGYQDDTGYFHFVGRMTDRLRCHGEMISPAEIEDVLRLHPGVDDAAVIGIESELGQGEQLPVAFVETGERSEANETGFVHALLQLCSDRLARFKQPSEIIPVEIFPRTALGKIRKTELQALWNTLNHQRSDSDSLPGH